MNGQLLVAVAPVAGLALNALSQIAGVHILHLKLSHSIVAGVLFGLAITVAVILLELAASPPDYPGLVDICSVGILTYLALAFGFWTFLNLNITSLRIRALRMMLRAGGSVELDDLRVRYGADERLSRRLERLRSGGQIRLEGNRWRLNSWEVLLIARCVDVLRLIVIPTRNDRK